MEFSRRGPATGGVGDERRRFPEPPAHGEREPMLVTRDALLSQLHMACLRQEIIEGDLANIERAMVLHAATGGQQTPTMPMPMPMPWHGVAGRSKAAPFSAEQPVALQNAEFDDRKLPGSNKDALLSQLHMARLRQKIIEDELAEIERAMALCATTGGHQTLANPVSMPWHVVTTADAGLSKAGPVSAEQPVAQQNAEFDDRKLLNFNKAIPPSKTSPEAKLEPTGIPIPVMKPKSPMKWSCAVCQVEATCEQNLQQHYVGQKHLSNVATLDPTRKASGHMAKTTAEPSLGTGQKKTSSIKWNCSTCQANGTSQSTFESHLKGKRHQENIVAATGMEGDKNGIPKSVMAKTAAVSSLGTEQKKTSSIQWSCSTCQANGTSQSTLEAHLKGKRHQQNIGAETGVEGDKNGILMSVMAKTAAEPSLGTEQKKTSSIKWSCSTCQANGTSQSTLDSHLKGKRHQQNIGAAAGVEGDKNVIPKSVMATTAEESSLGTEQKKTSSIQWSCSTCQAKGISQSTLEAHIKGKRHQQNIGAATSMEGEKNGVPRNVAAQEAERHSVNVPMYSEKPPSAWSCSICQVVCTCQTDLKNHLGGVRHREKVQSLLEQSKNKAIDSESWKSKLNPDSRWICGVCHALFTCESDAENHLAGHQLDIQVPREKTKQDNSNQPQLAKNKEPTSEWNCAMCEAKCQSRSQFEAHCGSSRHQQKIQVILGNGNIAEGSSSRTISEVPSDGPNSKNPSSEKAVKQPTQYFCEVCNLLCESSTALVHHRYGKRHRAKLSARNEPS